MSSVQPPIIMDITRAERRNSSKSMKEELFKYAMNHKWEEVVKIYEKDHNRAYKAKITRSGYTALHLAITEIQEEVVEKLVELIKRSCDPAEAKEVLTIKNERGHSPLHIAAQTGNVRICACIATVDPSLVHIRDGKGKTPLYAAVQYGGKKAFLYLSSLLPGDDHRLSCCTKTSDRMTILHNAIINENFGE
ncbi:Transmembrane protein [Trema orientale]|uniref:Transmembrane protein n=1 Tax=Trema orientale TaxID=63057 RepID=A0A2P5ALT3_TREOI|nr:Transmembrane protein [Trema orientale]